MSNKILVVGGVAGGASVAARARRLDEFAEITMYERGPHVSYSNCALPFYLNNVVSEASELVLKSPKMFDKQFNIEAKVNHEVVDIHPNTKTIEILNKETNELMNESYDYLILSPGAKPRIPTTLRGTDRENVFTIRNVPDIDGFKHYLKENFIEEVTVIGGGFIGLEMTENLVKSGHKVHLIESTNQVLEPFDYDLSQILHKDLIDHGVSVFLEDSAKEITSDSVKLNSGKKVGSGAVVIAAGVDPGTELAQKAGLKIGTTGGIKVNHHYQTSEEFIYAVGDAIEVTHKITKKPTRLTLAGPAQMQARAAADHIYGKNVQNPGVIGSTVLQCFDMNAAATGLSEKDCQREDIPYQTSYVIPKDKVGLMPNAHPIFFKLIFQDPTGKILGAQAIRKGDVDKRINVVATAIHLGATLEDLKELELAYSPMFNTAKDPVNMAVLVGLNVLNGEFKQVPVTKVRELVETNAFIMDVREKTEFDEGHLLNAVNIPMSEFRDRLEEIPTDQPVYVHCLSSHRSYNVVKALGMLGFNNVYNIQGSYLGFSMYEYFNDQIYNREPIMTNYRFDLL